MSMRLALLALALAAGACAGPRPIHPMRLQGFPGAPIEPDLFPLRPGARWVFAEGERRLELRLRADGDEILLEGRKEGRAVVRTGPEFLEILYEGKVVERPLKLAGKVGDEWRAGEARYTAFGYDEIDVLGEPRRALVVASDRPPVRDLYWFVGGVGWVRIRTERRGRVVRDARLVEFEPGGAN
jgi:hypothetical protein